MSDYWDLIDATALSGQLRSRLTGEGADATTVYDPLTGRDGTWVGDGTVSYSDDRPVGFIHGQSMAFDGDLVLSVGSLGVNNTARMTSMAWVKLDSLQSTYLFHSQLPDAAGGNRYHFRPSTDGNWGFVWGNTALNNRPGCPLAIGEWQHVAHRVTASSYEIILDGEVTYTNSTTVPNAQWHAAWEIGGQQGVGSLTGLVYEPMVFRYELSLSEIEILAAGPGESESSLPAIARHYRQMRSQ